MCIAYTLEVGIQMNTVITNQNHTRALTMRNNKPLLAKRISFSIEEPLLNDLNTICDISDINRSSIIRKLVLEWMLSRTISFLYQDLEPESIQLQQHIDAKSRGSNNVSN